MIQQHIKILTNIYNYRQIYANIYNMYIQNVVNKYEILLKFKHFIFREHKSLRRYTDHTKAGQINVQYVLIRIY